MPFGAIAGGLAAGIGGAVVSSALSPSASGGTNGSGGYYVPTGLNYADTSWQSLLGQELGAQTGINSATSAYGPGYQTAANAAGLDYQSLAYLMQGQGAQAYNTQNSLLNAGQQVYNMGLDPNQAQYNLSLGNLQQQTGATNSMYGLGSSAAGAGIQDQALSNFNINWNTQQLQNAESALQSYTGAAQEAGQYGQYGTALYGAAPGYQLSAGQTPYSTATTIAGQPISSAQSIQSNIIPYLNYGNGAQTVAYQSQSAGAGAAGSLASNAISGLGTAYQNAGSLGNLFSGTTGSFGGGNFSGAFTSSPYYSGGGNSYGFTLGD